MKNYFLSNNNGFTLIELIMIIILLGILSATAVVLVGNVMEQQKFDETVKEMSELKKAMLGNPELISSGARSSFGSVGDVGSLPSSLTALVEKGALPVFQKTGGTGGYDTALPDLGTGAGWRGPYIDDKKDDSGNYIALRDGWGTLYTYNSSTGQITSYGPDLALGGGDDIVIPESSIAGFVYGEVTGNVSGNQGGAVEGATVTMYYPNRASQGNHRTSVRTTNSSGIFSNITGIPIGRHTMKVASGSRNIYDTVVVDGGQAQTKNFVIADMIAPSPPTNTSAARASYTSLSLSWTPSPTTDVVGYQIWRDTTPGGEQLYATISGGATSSYIGSGLNAGTTYYYIMYAVDSAGNISPATTETNETVNPIQSTATAPSWNGPHNVLTIEIKNNEPAGGGTNLSITNLIINATGCTTTCNDYVNRVTICGTNRNPTPDPAPNNTEFTITGATVNADTTCNLEIRFSNAVGTTSANYPASVSIQMNPATFVGSFTKTGL